MTHTAPKTPEWDEPGRYWPLFLGSLEWKPWFYLSETPIKSKQNELIGVNHLSENEMHLLICQAHKMWLHSEHFGSKTK